MLYISEIQFSISITDGKKTGNKREKNEEEAAVKAKPVSLRSIADLPNSLEHCWRLLT